MTGNVAVLDVGKKLVKLSLRSPEGDVIAKITRYNRQIKTANYLALDEEGIRDWLPLALSSLARKAPIESIVTIGHGAAAVIVRSGRVACPPVDYENVIPDAHRSTYLSGRDPFALTGSSAMPNCLNLGAQLHWLEQIHPGILSEQAQLLLWPQYWSWFLSGVLSSEVTSLGCHTDLWNPNGKRPSPLAVRRQWARSLPPLRRADEILGPIRPELAARTGLSPDVNIYCGIHDSNAALQAARAYRQLWREDTTIISTGTWFISMRTPKGGQAFQLAQLPQGRDCLSNVDMSGDMVPSARFMGGREVEMLVGSDSRRIDIVEDQPALIEALSQVLAQQAMILPTFARGVGPFPDKHGLWVNKPSALIEQRAAAALYAALVADTSLDLIGSCGNILVEGPFGNSEVMLRALATLRPGDKIFRSGDQMDVSFGALRLVRPELTAATELKPVPRLALDLKSYREAWLDKAQGRERAA